jgi:hypothetical protein
MSVQVTRLGFFRRHRELRRSLALLVAGVMSSGCMTWRFMYESPGQVIARHPGHVMVSLYGGSQLDLYSPAVNGNELVGYRRLGWEASLISVPMREVRDVKVRCVDAGRTATLVASVGATVAFLAIIASQSLHFGGGGGGCGMLGCGPL